VDDQVRTVLVETGLGGAVQERVVDVPVGAVAPPDHVGGIAAVDGRAAPSAFAATTSAVGGGATST